MQEMYTISQGKPKREASWAATSTAIGMEPSMPLETHIFPPYFWILAWELQGLMFSLLFFSFVLFWFFFYHPISPFWNGNIYYAPLNPGIMQFVFTFYIGSQLSFPWVSEKTYTWHLKNYEMV